MKKSFTRSTEHTTEQLDINNEEKWIYVYYLKDNVEKTAYILKNNQKKDAEYLVDFWQDAAVSEELKAEVLHFLETGKKKQQENWMKFSTFLIKALSYHVVVGIILAASIFAGYWIGEKLDLLWSIDPLFKVLGIIFGIALGGYSGYIIIKHHLLQGENHEEHMSFHFSAFFKSHKSSKKGASNGEVPKLDVSIDQVRNAVKRFSEQLPADKDRTCLINEDFSIDFSKLSQILGGLPSEKFYMSKETYDIFVESEKEIPEIMDKVQMAVHHYVKEFDKLPIMPYDPLRRVNVYELVQKNYLDAAPSMDFFITNHDGIITHEKASLTRMGY